MLALARLRLGIKSGHRLMPAGLWFNAVKSGQRTGGNLNEVVVVDHLNPSDFFGDVGMLGLRGKGMVGLEFNRAYASECGRRNGERTWVLN
jgi:hypothetical protein